MYSDTPPDDRPSRPNVMAILFSRATAVPHKPGCTCKGFPVSRVDPDRAREALRTVLETWKKGDPPQRLKSAAPPIVVHDQDWSAGHRLVKYELTSDGENLGARLLVPVRLTLRTAQGKEAVKSVSYRIITSALVRVQRK